MRLEWDKDGEKMYEVGVDQAVLFPQNAEGKYPKGIAWNGMVNVNESPSGAEATKIYADNQVYGVTMSNEELKLTIEAYMYPDEFMDCDGSREIAPGIYVGQQNRKKFGFAYRTLIGNDTEGTEKGEKLHLVYGCLASPSEKAHGTVNESVEVGTLSWEVSTTPVAIKTLIDEKKLKPTAQLVVDSTKVSKEAFQAVADMIYGTENKDATLPTPDEVLALINP